jgi:hypothetical protein
MSVQELFLNGDSRFRQVKFDDVYNLIKPKGYAMDLGTRRVNAYDGSDTDQISSNVWSIMMYRACRSYTSTSVITMGS